MIAVPSVVAEQRGRTVEVVDDRVKIAVVVVVAQCQAAALVAARQAEVFGLFGEVPAILIHVDQPSLFIFEAHLKLVGPRVKVSVDHEQVRARIVVEVAKRDAPSDEKVRALSVSRHAGDVSKTAVTVVHEQRIAFKGGIGVDGVSTCLDHTLHVVVGPRTPSHEPPVRHRIDLYGVLKQAVEQQSTRP